MKIIEDADLIKKCQLRLKSKFFFQADKKPKPVLSWKLPTAKVPYEVNYISRFNMWGCYIENPHKSNKHWNGFGIGEPKAGKACIIDLTVAFAKNGKDRDQCAVFVEKEGEILVCHTGLIYGAADYFWEKFNGQVNTGTYADGEEVKLAVVGNLDSDSCLGEFASFAKEVKKIRAIKKIEKKRAKEEKTALSKAKAAQADVQEVQVEPTLPQAQEDSTPAEGE